MGHLRGFPCVREFSIRDDDRGIVILLQKLHEPEMTANGKLVGEVAAIEAKQREKLEDEYESWRRIPIGSWRLSHPDELAGIEREVCDTMTTPRTDIGYRAKLTMRERRRRRTDRIPDFDEWRAQQRAS